MGEIHPVKTCHWGMDTERANILRLSKHTVIQSNYIDSLHNLLTVYSTCEKKPI